MLCSTRNCRRWHGGTRTLCSRLLIESYRRNRRRWHGGTRTLCSRTGLQSRRCEPALLERDALRLNFRTGGSLGKRVVVPPGSLVVITNITETFIGQESVQGRFVTICLSLIPDSVRLEHLIRCLRHSLPRRLEPALLERDAQLALRLLGVDDAGLPRGGAG